MMSALRYLLVFIGMAVLVPAHATVFKIATIAPDGTRWMEEMRKGADEIEKQTQGRVQIRYYPGGVMGNDKSVLRKIRIGQLQGGAITGGGLAEIYPDSQVYSFPFAFNSYEEVDHVRKRLDPLLIAGMKENGFVSFGISEGGFAYLMSSAPVAGIDNLKGRKVWVPEGDEISRASFEAAKISPISLPLTDVLTGLQTGMIDTVEASTVGAIALQWYTQVKYMNDVPLMYLYGTMVVKRDLFEKLSAADQAVVSRVMGDVFTRLDTINRADNEAAKDVLKQRGITIVHSTEQETRRWREASAQAMEKVKSRGQFSPAILKALDDTLADSRKNAAKH
ncbi:MAG TPA: TRAP transporter substrate-binding protein DctP [Gammaproteobacteria bacterium]